MTGVVVGIAAVVVYIAMHSSGHSCSSETASPKHDLFDLSKLAIQLLHTPLPRACPDAAYLYQELDCNILSVVAAASELKQRCPGMISFVLNIDNSKLGSPIASGYGGTAYLLRELKKAGLETQAIDVVDFDHSGMVHTLVESETAIQHARKRGWRSIVLVAPAFHLLRASLTAATVALRVYPELRLHPFPGAALPWYEEAQHSQGIFGTRGDFIEGELDRIVRYISKGDIAPLSTLGAFFAASEIPSSS